ncbi:putative polysaccharide biosynthesis protein [Limosilactobacillus kribbianus]|uniref:putative polysaccharide biosynthesis protein n=1 Tax=Limosilactobacillus kribbianus TaxID=2982695 RepID=UPI002263BDE0|nr:polysaccharide biosynthesis protein [Limosilactobacillus kribbianus]
MNKKILSGAFWLSAGSIVSRILGVIYLIPWLMMMGSSQHIATAQALFNSAYTPYALFISLGTAGFPSAIARRVAYYNGREEYGKSRELFRSGAILMGISGLICGALLFLLAPLIARNSPVVSIPAATRAIRMVAPALVLIPLMSVMRGWFQGNQDLKPFGVSQVIEQFVRVIFILGASYIVIFTLHQPFQLAVQLSVFAAFIGAIAGFAYLGGYYRRHPYCADAPAAPLDLGRTTHLMALTFYESVPFLFVGSGITLVQLVDQIFFKQIMRQAHYSASAIQYIYTLFSANPAKITAIVIALATAVSETSLPLLAAEKDHLAKVQKLISQNLAYLLLVLLPIVIILAALAYEVNLVFYTRSVLGGNYLRFNLTQSLLMALGVNGLTILQALRYSKKAMLYMGLGLVTKIVLQYPLVMLANGRGAIMATNIAYIVICLLTYGKIVRQFKIGLVKYWRIVAVNLVFLAIVAPLSLVVSHFYLPMGKVSAFIFAAVVGLIMLGIYLVLIDLTSLSYRHFGRYFILKRH